LTIVALVVVVVVVIAIIHVFVVGPRNSSNVKGNIRLTSTAPLGVLSPVIGLPNGMSSIFYHCVQKE